MSSSMGIQKRTGKKPKDGKGSKVAEAVIAQRKEGILLDLGERFACMCVSVPDEEGEKTVYQAAKYCLLAAIWSLVFNAAIAVLEEDHRVSQQPAYDSAVAATVLTFPVPILGFLGIFFKNYTFLVLHILWLFVLFNVIFWTTLGVGSSGNMSGRNATEVIAYLLRTIIGLRLIYEAMYHARQMQKNRALLSYSPDTSLLYEVEAAAAAREKERKEKEEKEKEQKQAQLVGGSAVAALLSGGKKPVVGKSGAWSGSPEKMGAQPTSPGAQPVLPLKKSASKKAAAETKAGDWPVDGYDETGGYYAGGSEAAGGGYDAAGYDASAAAGYDYDYYGGGGAGAS